MSDTTRLRDLMVAYQQGRFEAFDELYARVAPAVRRYLIVHTRDAARADDLLQETFLQIHRARHTFDPAFPLMPWATAIARHMWLMDRRTASRRPWETDDVTEMEIPIRADASAFAERAEVGREIPASLRARLAADYQPVKHLPLAEVRTLWLLPFALLALFAAPIGFSLREDAVRLGMIRTWGLSSFQVVIGLVLVFAALRESVPGRSWNRRSAALWVTLPLAIVIFVTLATWELSQTWLQRGWWTVGALCLTGTVATALPVVTLASVLAARAYPTRPALAGALLGLGAGLMADAGWRLFCHFSEPAHVLSAHLGAVLVSMWLGSLVASAISRARRRS